MTFYEILTLFISLIAVVISVASLVRMRKISHQQLELEKKTAALAEKQLEIIEAKEKESSVAKIDVELEGSGSNYKFVIKNIGGSVAKNVNFSIDGVGYPLVASEYAEKIPISILGPGKFVELFAPRTTTCGSKYEANLFWTNPDGSQGSDKIMVHW